MRRVVGPALRANRAMAPLVEDVDPNGETVLTFAEFTGAVEMLRSVGYPVEHPAEQAWPHFRGWRLNYEEVAYRLAYVIDAPPAGETPTPNAKAPAARWPSTLDTVCQVTV